MNYKSLIVFGVLFFTSYAIQAQPVSSVKYETMLEVADEAAENNDFPNAIVWFEKAYKESKNKDLKVAIGDLYMRLRDYKRAERSYNVVLKRDKDGVYEDLRVDYAKALKYQGKYKEAVNHFRIVASTADSDTLKNIALFELKGIELMDTYVQNIEAVVDFAGKKVNSGSGENSPSLASDGTLYYSSFNRKKEIVLDGKEEEYQAKIFSATKDDKGELGKPKALNSKVNRDGWNNAGVSFSGDGRIMYFSRAKLNVNEIEESKLFYSLRKDSGWGAAQELEGLNGDYLSMHPQEGELFGNKVLFFVSDMEGGYGGLDIYYATINGDSYATPVNLGETINTDRDDVTPFYTNGTLYYSTDGRPGFGGYDIWYATWNGAGFQDATNMGFNYNSPQDDMYLKFNPNGKGGFMTSNRPHKDKRKLKGSTTCCDDIYEIEVREIVIDLLVNVLDADGPLKEATVELVDLSIDDENAFESKTNLLTNDFNFLLDADHKYRVVVSREGYYPDTTISFNTVGLLDSYTVKKDVTLKAMPPPPPPTNTDGNGNPEEEVEIVEMNQPIRLNNIYYDLAKWDILPDAEDDLGYLKTLLDQYSDMVIELSSHTDVRGKKGYNQRLSQKRADSAKSWLVSQGISSSRIQTKGYGETVIINHCVEGVRCADSEHRVNRRTEFKIIAGPQYIEIKKQVIRKKTIGSFNSGQQSYQEPYPFISFVRDSIDLGTLIHGDKKALEFHFTNTGDTDLLIEVVTACKCTDLEWPVEAIKPGEQGVISAIFDTADQHLGEVIKTVDIIANTKLIVTEARFKANIVDKLKKAK
ncbi:MAG: DUF1573 domain-containing protein [Saprospiraceae bacterium]